MIILITKLFDKYTNFIAFFFVYLLFSEFAERRCSAEGKWEGKMGENQPNGWTNYTSCFTPETRKLLDQVGHASVSINSNNFINVP